MTGIQDKMQATGTDPLSGPSLLAALSLARVEVVAALPDISTSQGLLWPLSTDKRFRLVRICKEDEGVSICAALSYCGKRAVLSMQHTGLYDSLNAVRGIAMEYGLPVCMLVGLLLKEPDRAPEDSARYDIRILRPMLKAMELETLLIETAADIDAIPGAIDLAYANSKPIAILLGKRVVA